MNKTSIKVVARGKRIYREMSRWLDQRPWSGAKARSSMTAELLDAARRNLAMEQDEMKQMKAGTYEEQRHRELYTEAFLKRGGSFH